MPEIINLRQRRKQLSRAKKRKEGDANSVAFGRSKSERSLTKAQKALEARRVDGHKRGDTDEP